jgi:hypothetical protein
LIEFHFNIAALEWCDKPKIPDVEGIPKLGFHLKKGFGILKDTLSNKVEEEERPEKKTLKTTNKRQSLK